MTRKLLMGTGAIMLASAAVLYGIMGGGGKEASTACASSARTVERFAPLATGGLAAMTIPKSPRPAIDVTFDGPNGEKKSLADFRGKTILLNLWATWCVPCRAEMPALDHLQKTLGGDQFEVLALNMDTRNPEKVPQWLKENGIAALTLYTDAEGKAFQTLRKESLVTGLPTTFLVDAKGCVLGGMAGPAEWDSADALALLSSVIDAGRLK